MRRDEAAAKAADEAAEERMQEADAARRLAILRGEEPLPLPEEEEKPHDPAAGPLARDSGRDRLPGEKRKRKRAGEDDTDFEMRVAMERAADVAGIKPRSDGPVELAGLLNPEEHKQLFKPLGRDEVAGEKQRAERAEREKLMNPVLKDVLGIKEDPWFAKTVKPGEVIDEPGRDAWGREDPGRKARDAVRIDKNDPLAMMKRGAAKVREVTHERKREMDERERELRTLRKEERRREKRKKREGKVRDETGDLEGFSLDAPAKRVDAPASEMRHHRSHPHEKRRHDEGTRHTDGDAHHRSSHRPNDRHKSSQSQSHTHRHRHRSRDERERGP